MLCKSIHCDNSVEAPNDFCSFCIEKTKNDFDRRSIDRRTMAEKYPKYYKPVGELTEIDVYAVHYLFEVNDPSGALQHASKKLLLSGVRTGGKSKTKDITEARDTLTRWLELNPEVQVVG